MATASQDNPLNLVDKTEYSELTDKQQAVVDAVIDLGRDASDPDVAGVAGVTRQYARAVRDVHGHIIDDRIGAAPGESANGEERTEGVEDALQQLDEQFADEREPQHITESPKWSVVGSTIEMEGPPEADAEEDTMTVCLEFGVDEVESIVSGGAPNVPAEDIIRRAVTDELFDRAGL